MKLQWQGVSCVIANLLKMYGLSIGTVRYHSKCPLVGIGTPPTPLPQASVPPSLPTPEPKGEGGGTVACGWRVGESQFRRLEKRLSTLPTLCRKSSNHRRLQLHKSNGTILHPLLDVGNVADPLHQVLNEGCGGECPAPQPHPHVEHHEVGPGQVVPGKELTAAAGQPRFQVSQHDLADGLEFGLHGFLNFGTVSEYCGRFLRLLIPKTVYKSF
jgi:hypothetical protein